MQTSTAMRASTAMRNFFARRNFTRNARPAAFGVALLGSMMVATAARAEPPSPKLMLSAYADGPQGEALLAGRYDLVILRLGSHGAPFDDDEVSASTNLCVAYIMTRRWSSAEAACDEAVRDAKLDAPEPTMFSRLARDQEVAIAYSNRAVLKAVEGQPRSAADDKARARTLAHGDLVT